jgi:hypothetical protein
VPGSTQRRLHPGEISSRSSMHRGSLAFSSPALFPPRPLCSSRLGGRVNARALLIARSASSSPMVASHGSSGLGGDRGGNGLGGDRGGGGGLGRWRLPPHPWSHRTQSLKVVVANRPRVAFLIVTVFHVEPPLPAFPAELAACRGPRRQVSTPALLMPSVPRHRSSVARIGRRRASGECAMEREYANLRSGGGGGRHR